MSRRLESGLLIVIFLLSLMLRLIGLRWGLPYPYDFDGFFLVRHAVGFFSGDFNPHEFVYPTFHKYFLFFVYRLIYGIGYLAGRFSSIHEFRSLLDINPSIFIITGRTVAAFFGSGSVILCYILAKRLFSRKVAFLVLLLAILPMEVQNAHYCTTDTPLVFWFLLIFIFCTVIMEKQNLKYYITAGLLTGAAGGTKYPGLGAVLPITIAHLVRLYRLEKGWRPILFCKEHYKLIIALMVGSLAFFISTPYVFLDYKQSLPNIIGEFKIRYTSVFDIYQRANENQMFLYEKEALLNFGYLFTLLGLVGMGMKIKKITREELLLLSWIIFFAIVIHISKLKQPRYFLLLSPFLLIFFANAIIGLEEMVKKKFAWGKCVTIFIVLLIPIQPLYHSIKNNIILIRPDSRQHAHDWIIENIPEGTVIAQELLFTPFLPKNRYKIVYVGWSLGDHEMAWYKERDVEYFLVSKTMKERMSYPARPSLLHRQFYKDLENEAHLIYSVSEKAKGLFMEFHNPTVFIYKIK